MPNPTLICVYGLPAAGKSSLCRRLVSLDPQRFVHVCYDELIDDVASVSHNRWKADRLNVLDACRSLLREDQEKCVLIDDNLYYKSMRRAFRRLARETRCSFAQIFCQCDVGECLRRNASRAKKCQVSERSVQKMHDVFIEEKRCVYEERVTIDVNMEEENLDVQAIVRFIDDATVPPEIVLPDEASRSIDRATTRVSLAHNVDLTLRQCVTDAMRRRHDGGVEDGREFGRLVSGVKAGIAGDVRSGRLDVDEEGYREVIRGVFHIKLMNAVHRMK